MNVLIVGAGAVGALFGSALARQGARVAVVCRSDYDAVSRDGYDIRSPVFGDHRFRPDHVYRERRGLPRAARLPAADVEGAGERRSRGADPAGSGSGTVIVLIQNGVDIEPPIAAAFPDNELLSSLAFVAVGRSAPGQVNHQSLGSLILGRYPQGITPAAQRIAAAFEAGKVPCKLTENVVGARWQKAVWNATFNPISILGGVLDTAAMLKTEANQAFARRAMQEVCDVARAAGHPQSPNLIEQMIATTKAMPAYKTSMALDYENGRPMEIEAILGNTVRAARKLGVATPNLDAIYAIATMVAGKVRLEA